MWGPGLSNCAWIGSLASSQVALHYLPGKMLEGIRVIPGVHKVAEIQAIV